MSFDALKALDVMLTLQDRMNCTVTPEWVNKDFNWHDAVWVECAELLDQLGYKWWKFKQVDIEAARMEVVDIYHFMLSIVIESGIHPAYYISKAGLSVFNTQESIPAAKILTRELASHYTSKCKTVLDSANPEEFNIFMSLCGSLGMTYEELYERYIGKNALNIFRQNNGYKDGTYEKVWGGREDNEYASEFVKLVFDNKDIPTEDKFDEIYHMLDNNYQCIVLGAVHD